MSEERKIIVRPAMRDFMKTSRVGIYCRVSIRSQEQLDSLANQVSFPVSILWVPGSAPCPFLGVRFKLAVE